MTAEPIHPEQPDTGSYEVIHLGDRAAVVVPMADFMRLRALERQASVEALEDAEDLAFAEAWRAREDAGLNTYVPAEEAWKQLGLDR